MRECVVSMMKGAYTERIDASSIPFREIVSNILNRELPDAWMVERFCDDAEGTIVRYHVYKITMEHVSFVLKRSDQAEINVYERLLTGRHFFGTQILWKDAVERSGLDPD